jgi:hypothetical protein
MGCAGAFIPGAIVRHHHGRKAGGPEAAAANAGYTRGRGAYYAILMARGVTNAWRLWGSRTRVSLPGALSALRQEMEGAAAYLATLESEEPPEPPKPA